MALGVACGLLLVPYGAVLEAGSMIPGMHEVLLAWFDFEGASVGLECAWSIALADVLTATSVRVKLRTEQQWRHSDRKFLIIVLRTN